MHIPYIIFSLFVGLVFGVSKACTCLFHFISFNNRCLISTTWTIPYISYMWNTHGNKNTNIWFYPIYSVHTHAHTSRPTQAHTHFVQLISALCSAALPLWVACRSEQFGHLLSWPFLGGSWVPHPLAERCRGEGTCQPAPVLPPQLAPLQPTLRARHQKQQQVGGALWSWESATLCLLSSFSSDGAGQGPRKISLR